MSGEQLLYDVYYLDIGSQSYSAVNTTEPKQISSDFNFGTSVKSLCVSVDIHLCFLSKVLREDVSLEVYSKLSWSVSYLKISVE